MKTLSASPSGKTPARTIRRLSAITHYYVVATSGRLREDRRKGERPKRKDLLLQALNYHFSGPVEIYDQATAAQEFTTQKAVGYAETSYLERNGFS